jgi:2-amino-4-hydroxy-6-hydroxymethyldihydropteridine diphosphokinase
VSPLEADEPRRRSPGGAGPDDDDPGTQAFLGLGSNLGDRLANLQRAVDLLSQSDGVSILRSSRVYETDPVGPAQPDFLNAVVEVATSLPAAKLLRSCLAVENEMGRQREERWGPRVIDIDLLSYGREEIEEPGLVIPHPRMHERLFVLAPLLELDADPVLPGGRRLASLRLASFSPSAVRTFSPALRLTPASSRGGSGH